MAFNHHFHSRLRQRRYFALRWQGLRKDFPRWRGLGGGLKPKIGITLTPMLQNNYYF